jgi:CheY-like chemotaxis protein
VGEAWSPLVILMADDDEDDCLLAKSALEEIGMTKGLRIVGDGGELMEYLYRQGRFSDSALSPRPDLILLDLNMPRKDGREVLGKIKSDPQLQSIPVVILTTSREERDIALCKKAGASALITKPVMFEEWVEVAKSLFGYLPNRAAKNDKQPRQ